MIYLFDTNDATLHEIKAALDGFKREGMKMILVENKTDLIHRPKKFSLKKALKEDSANIPFDAFCSISTFEPNSIEQLKILIYNHNLINIELLICGIKLIQYCFLIRKYNNNRNFL